MNKESKILHRVVLATALAALLCTWSCRKKGILPKDDVSSIMYEMFVADEYAKKYTQVSKAADSLLLYQHIFDRYGCSLDEYRNSIRYYIADEKAYTYILKRAVQIAKDSASQANRDLSREVPHGITAMIPYPSEGMEVPIDTWWTRLPDGSYPVTERFHDRAKRIGKEAELEEKRKQEQLNKGVKKEPELVLTKEAQKIRDDFRRNLDEGK